MNSNDKPSNSEIDQYKLFVSLLERLNPEYYKGLSSYTAMLKNAENEESEESRK